MLNGKPVFDTLYKMLGLLNQEKFRVKSYCFSGTIKGAYQHQGHG